MKEGAIYTKIFGDNLCLCIKIASGSGERLADYLGLKIDEIIGDTVS